MIPANFRRGARFAWRAMLEAATEAERPALVESADLLFEYVDRVSRIYSEVYEIRREEKRTDRGGDRGRRPAASDRRRGGPADRGLPAGRADRLPDRAGGAAVRDRVAGPFGRRTTRSWRASLRRARTRWRRRRVDV